VTASPFNGPIELYGECALRNTRSDMCTVAKGQYNNSQFIKSALLTTRLVFEDACHFERHDVLT